MIGLNCCVDYCWFVFVGWINYWCLVACVLSIGGLLP